MSRIDEIKKSLDAAWRDRREGRIVSPPSWEDVSYLLSYIEGRGVEAQDPVDMLNEELDAAMDFHRREAARFSNERAKIWRMRIQWPDGGTDVDKKMLADLHA